MKSFMDGFSRYNQILIVVDDISKMADKCLKHSSYTRVLSHFRFISISNKCVYCLIFDTRFLCISGEKGTIGG